MSNDIVTDSRRFSVAATLCRKLCPWLFILFCGVPVTGQDLQQEEEDRYYQKWLNEDVVYIITEDEKKVFQNLTTPQEKEQFIEQFWRRRDTDPSTAFNEFREEHYRRIAYANDHFTSGVAGWRTDRGRIYITHGPPEEIQSFTAGSAWVRTMAEGGGRTRTFPYEIWRYRHIEGIGQEVELEFVDKSFSGSFQLVLNQWEKDLNLHVGNLGKTLAEEIGAKTRADHPYFNPAIQDQDIYPFFNPREADRPFQRLQRVFAVQRPPEIKYKDLQEVVQVNVTFDNLEYQLREDYLRLSSNQVLVPVTVSWRNKDLTFTPNPATGAHQAKIAVYGIVTGLSNEIVAEFEHEVVSSYPPEHLDLTRAGKSMFQRIFLLPYPGRYKLNLVCKDLNSGKVGVQTRGLIPPRFHEQELEASTLILADFVRRLTGPDLEKDDLMFVLGDLWIRPSVDRIFQPGSEIGVYLQLYHAKVDQQTLKPELEVKYRIEGQDGLSLQIQDLSGRSVDFVSGERVVLLKVLKLGDLPPGRYSVEVEVTDQLSGQKVQAREPFSIVVG
jgi:GWxTD domain-containing protein